MKHSISGLLVVTRRKLAAGLAVWLFLVPGVTLEGKDHLEAQQTRRDYLARVQQEAEPREVLTSLGTLWVFGGKLTDLGSDYKASHLHDTVIIQVVQQTTASASGNNTAQRALDSQSKITALPGRLKTGGLNPLLGLSSSENLKGQGQTASTSKLQTSLAGQVIAVLPNGNLVLEAQREVNMNRERETAIVRGVVRPGDINADNTVLSTSLADLQIELKGKGVISNATRPPNIVTRLLQKVLGL